MEACKVARSEVAAFDECHSQGIAKYQLGSSARGRGKVVRTCLVLNGGIEYDVGLLGKKGVGVAYDGDELVAKILD